MATLGDILAGKPGLPDPMDEKSGVKLVVEPSKRLLEGLDRLCAMAASNSKTLSREDALLAFAASGDALLKIWNKAQEGARALVLPEEPKS